MLKYTNTLSMIEMQRIAQKLCCWTAIACSPSLSILCAVKRPADPSLKSSIAFLIEAVMTSN